MMRFFEFDTNDLREDFWIFWQRDGARHLQLRQRYTEFVCRKCGRLDVFGALNAGIADDIPPLKVHRDFALTHDNLNLASRRLVDVLTKIPGVLFHTYPIPTMPDHFVLVPETVFEPPRDSPVFRPIDPHRKGEPFQVRRYPCKKCHRVASVTFFFEWFRVPDDVHFAGVKIEQPRTPHIALITSERVVEVLSKHSFVGLRLISQENA